MANLNQTEASDAKQSPYLCGVWYTMSFAPKDGTRIMVVREQFKLVSQTRADVVRTTEVLANVYWRDHYVDKNTFNAISKLSNGGEWLAEMPAGFVPLFVEKDWKIFLWSPMPPEPPEPPLPG